MIYVIATLRIRPGTLEAAVEAATPCIEATRLEPGCALYDLHASLTDPERLVFFEQWESQEALASHFQSAHLRAWAKAGQAFIVSSRVEIVHPDRVETL